MTPACHRRVSVGPVAIALCMVAMGTPETASAAKPPATRSKAPATPRPAATPTSIGVTVVQLAGTQAYLMPGASAGVHRGAKVVINRRQYAVVETTDSYAAIEVGSEPPNEQDRGTASVVGVEEEKAKQLAKPHPLSTWEHAWTPPDAPANSQTPRFVPLGNPAQDRRWDVRLSMAAGGVLPIGAGGGIGRTELNARVHAEPFRVPGALDLDVSLQRWFAADLSARNGSASRPLLWLRELLISRDAGGWYAGLGRMAYAAGTLGPLDGARVHAPVGQGLSVGAFGGFLPNPLSGEPSLAAQRFGVEATYNRPEADLRPEAAIVLHGSTFDGSLDERRLSATFGLYPGLSRVGGYVEVSNFAADNPWKASAIELTAAGFDASARAGIVKVGTRLDVLQPVRSRWLASFLPTSWLCRTVPSAAGVPEPCDGSVSTRAMGTVDAGVEIDNLSVTAGFTTTRDLTQSGGAPNATGAFAAGRVLRIAKIGRFDLSGSYSRATYLNMFSAWAGPGVTLLGDALDVSLYYRNAELQYRFASTSLVQHGVGTTVALFPNAEVAFTLQSEATGGDDAKALFLFGTAMWRPQL